VIRTKAWNTADMQTTEFQAVNKLFDHDFGPGWPQVPLRRWEYVAGVVFSDILLFGKNVRVLEAGAGRSVFSPFLARHGFNVDCFDMGGADDRRARDNQLGVADKITEHNMDLRKIGFANDTFNYVFCISAIEHVNAGRFQTNPDEPDRVGILEAMTELARVLKPGGIMFLTTDYAERYYPPPGLWDSGSHRIFDRLSLWDLIERSGLQLYGSADWSVNAASLRDLEPKGYAYTTFAITLRKPIE
jgi:SAM-dependent methyltransferase